jgi:hypothetical protein
MSRINTRHQSGLAERHTTASTLMSSVGSAEHETVVTRLIRERRLISTEEIRHDPR